VYHNGAAFEIWNFISFCLVVWFFFLLSELSNGLPLEQVLGICAVGIGARWEARLCVVESLHWERLLDLEHVWINTSQGIVPAQKCLLWGWFGK